VAFKRPYHYYIGRVFVWRRGKGDMVPVEILPRPEQPPVAPWLFRPTAGGPAVRIEDEDLQQKRLSTRSPSGV
jgi:hypothetical protein